MDQRKAAMYAAVCAAAVFVGMLLPWYSVPFGPFGTATANGFHFGYGTSVFVLCAVGGLAALAIGAGVTKGLPIAPKQLSLLALAGFGVGALVCLIDLARSADNSFFLGWGSKGVGIYLTLLAAAAGTYCSWILWQKTPGSASTPPAA